MALISKWPQKSGRLQEAQAHSFMPETGAPQTANKQMLAPKLGATSQIWAMLPVCFLNTYVAQVSDDKFVHRKCSLWLYAPILAFLDAFCKDEVHKLQKKKKKEEEINKSSSEFNFSFPFNSIESSCIIFIITESEICNAYLD